jgi:glutamate carboxypeptidase
MQIEVKGVASHAGNAYWEGASAIKEAAHAILEIEALSQKGGITYNCGVISGGTVINTVPDKCVFKIDIRISTIEEMNFAEQKIYEICKKCALEKTSRTATVITRRPPMEKTSKNLELLSIWNTCASRLGAGEYIGATKGGGSDAAYSTMLGIPSLCSCAMEGFDAHAITEHADLSTLATRANIICEVIKSL